MPAVDTFIEFLEQSEKYDREKPFMVHPTIGDGWNPDDPKLQNISWANHDVHINDLRESPDLALDTCGFKCLHHVPKNVKFNEPSDIKAYEKETADLVKNALGAEYTLCYRAILRANKPFTTIPYNSQDPLVVDRPVRGAHDFTFESAPTLIEEKLGEKERAQYLKPGYRIRIVNTWRPLLSRCEDRPLAMCSFSTIKPVDLVAVDRVYPYRTSELYYLRHEPNQKWYWISDQTPEEPILMIMYDSMGGPQARYCPHVSFHNPLAPEKAPLRESIETRTIVISKSE